MTRDEATKAVTAALAPPSDGATLLADQAFAHRIVAALTALKLLKLSEQQNTSAPEQPKKKDA
jgi:hypothetical protein